MPASEVSIHITITLVEYSPWWGQNTHWDSSRIKTIAEELSQELEQLGIAQVRSLMSEDRMTKAAAYFWATFAATVYPIKLPEFVKYLMTWVTKNEQPVQLKIHGRPAILLLPNDTNEEDKVQHLVNRLSEPELETTEWPEAQMGFIESEELERTAIWQAELVILRNILETRFNEPELKRLCFDLNVPYEELEGGVFSVKIMSFLDYLKRRGRIRDLIEIGQQQRPDAPWRHLHR